MEDDDFGVAPLNVELQLLAGIERDGAWLRYRASRADNVLVAAHARPRLGVVVIQIERMRLRLLQVVHDLARLMRALVETSRELVGETCRRSHARYLSRANLDRRL